MPHLGRILHFPIALALFLFCLPPLALAQGAGSSGTISGKILDPSGAVVPGATVAITNPVSGYNVSTKSGSNGQYVFHNVPFNNYHLTAEHSGFQAAILVITVRSAVPLTSDLSLRISSNETVTVEEHSDLVENEPTAHTDIDRKLYAKLPTEAVKRSRCARNLGRNCRKPPEKEKLRTSRRSTGRSSPFWGLGDGVATPDARYRLYRGRPEHPNSYFVDRTGFPQMDVWPSRRCGRYQGSQAVRQSNRNIITSGTHPSKCSEISVSA
jgi:hypothetical protein